MRTLYSVLQYVWAFPATALGITLALLARTTGSTCNIVEGVLEVAGGRIDKAISFLPRPLQFNAITLGHVVLGIDHVVLAACRAHEQVHVRQYKRWGVFFFPLYFGSSLSQLLRGRNPYWDNHFERQARQEK